MRVFLLESSFGAGVDKGHPDSFRSGLERLVTARQHELITVCHKLAHGYEYTSGVIPAFTSSLYEVLSSDVFDGALTDFLIGARRFCNDLIEGGVEVHDDDVVLLPTASARELAGLGAWLSELEAKPRTIIIFHWNKPSFFAPGTLDGTLMRQASRQIQRSRVPVEFYATQADLASALNGPLQAPVRLIESLTFIPPVTRLRSNAISRVGFLGGQRDAKGSSCLRELLPALSQQFEDVVFVLQDHGRSFASEIIGQVKNLEIIQDWLSEEQLKRLVLSLDFAILPYDRSFYNRSVSGIFTLLVGMGIACLVPDGTWMSKEIDEGRAAGLAYKGSKPFEIVQTFHEAYTTFPSLSFLAERRSANWQRSYSAEHIFSTILRC